MTAGAANGSTAWDGAVAWPEVDRPAELGDLVHWDAAELSVAIRTRVVTCVEVMTAHLDHIARVNPAVNAIVSLRPREQLLAEAAAKDELLVRGTYDGWMHGFPHAVKDLADVRGIESTNGFFQPPYGLGAATEDSLFVERLRAAGCIFIGKTNVPEFGLGSQTYNTVFGTTRNAYDQTRTSGGSSGGAAVAVALHMVPVADGSDFMGSLRNPPGWNNVFGLRPSHGRVPALGGDQFVAQAGVEGPIARTALDLALLLATMAGYDARAPLSIEHDPAALTAAGQSSPGSALTGKSVAWLGDLGGYLPMEPEVLRVTTDALDHARALGMSVTTIDSLPRYGSFSGNADLWPTWLVLRHLVVGAGAYETYRSAQLGPLLKPELHYEVEGLISGTDGNGPITGLDVMTASLKRSDLYEGFRRLFETHDFVVLPTAQVMPFDAAVHWPTEIHGVPMSSYHRWMEVTAIATLINAPALAVPAGLSSSGLPIGLQVIGRNHDDRALLEFAAAWEAETGFVRQNPPPLLAI